MKSERMSIQKSNKIKKLINGIFGLCMELKDAKNIDLFSRYSPHTQQIDVCGYYEWVYSEKDEHKPYDFENVTVYVEGNTIEHTQDDIIKNLSKLHADIVEFGESK